MQLIELIRCHEPEINPEREINVWINIEAWKLQQLHLFMYKSETIRAVPESNFIDNTLSFIQILWMQILVACI